MSSNRGSYKSLHPDIRQYRDIAPESLSDEVLLKLVHDNGKNPVAVKEALEALWNEEPAGQWVTNEKKTKKVTPPPQTSNERGGRGRGRSAPPGRGDSGRGGRGSGGRSSSVSTNTQNGRPRVSSSKTENSNTSTPNQFSKIEETEKTETVIETSTSSPSTTSNTTTTTSSTPTPTVTTTASAVVATKTTKLSTAPVWGSGPSLAQKIREQELAASAPPPPPVVVVEEEVRVESVEEVQTNSVAPVSSSSAGHSRRSPRTEGGRGRGRKRGGRDSQPPRSTHITSETNNNNSDNNENNNNNNNINDNIDENNINNSNNHVEQVVEENVEESVEQVVESIQNVHIEKIAEEIPEPVQNNNILQNDITNNNNTHNVQVIPDILMSPPRSNNPVTVSDTLVGSPVLKMGRWGASLESTDVSSFQFGSFGNLGHDNSSSVNDGDESPHKIASGLISSLTESQNTWGQQSQLDQNSLTQSDHETENVASLSVWGNTQSQNDNPDDSYNYDQQVSSSANDNSVHSAPPGLGLSLGGLDASSVVNQSGSNKSGNNRNSNRSAPGQTRKNDIDNNISRQPQSYYQGPPGMQPGGFGIPYGYGFDMNTLQPPTVGYGATTQTNSTSPGAPGTNSNGQAVNQNTTNNNNQNNSNQNTANNYNNANAAATGNNAPKYPGPPGMPAQMGAYPPYYANPYYSQAYFYGGAQPQNFYGRGGQAMYPPRPYGADPYAPPMPGYDMYGQPGQFGDAVYGQIPMQPMHPQQNATSNDNRQNNGKGGNKNVGPNTQQSAGAVGGVTGTSTNVGTTQPDANQAIHSGYGMGAYNAYGRADQGAAWPPYQAWNQMMFPPGVGLGGGYSPMGGIPPQPTNNRHDQTSRGGGGSGSYNSYGRGAGSSTNGQNDSTGIGGGTASW